MTKLTLKKLRELKRVPATRKFIGESVDEMRTRLLKELKKHDVNPEELIEHDNRFEFRDRFIMKPKLQDDIKGHIIFRSKDYYFEYDGNKSYGDIKSKQLTDYGFYLNTFNNERIEYHLEI